MSLSKLSLNPFGPPNPTLAHFNRLVATTSGTDKLFMIYAYGAHVINYILRSPHIATKERLVLAEKIAKLQAIVSDARVLYRLFGVFPIIGWSQALTSDALAPKDPQLQLIARLQTMSMMIYYPLEHYYYLGNKGLWKIEPLRTVQIARWSCRFWAMYVVLQFFHIRRDHELLTASKHRLALSRKSKAKGITVVVGEKGNEAGGVMTEEMEKAEVVRIKAKEKALKTDLLVQVGYLPLTMHWSLPNGLLPDQVWVGVCGCIAAMFGLQGAWRATAAR